MTVIIRRAWYVLLGMLAAWAWHRVRHASDTAGEMVTVTVAMPRSILPPMIAGLAIEAQAVLMSHVLPSADDGDDGGIDPATGMPFNGPDAER